MIIKLEGTASELANFLGFIPCDQMTVSPEAPETVESPAPTEKPNTPAKARRTDITLAEIKEEVDLEVCDSIPEVIEAIIEITGITGTRLAELLGIGAADISRAKKGKIFPFIERAFIQHLGFPANPEGDV